MSILADVSNLHRRRLAICEAAGDRWPSLTKCGTGLPHVEAGHGLIDAVFRKLLLGHGVETTEGPLVVTKTRHVLHRR